ncbi:MAG: response regulator [Deltaproteobacteria bacterium]|nr:response regulator [Deltaproteobacteria bacterium]
MGPSPDELEERWRRWRLERNRRGLRVGLILMGTLYPAFGVLDLLLAPPQALTSLLVMRLGVAVAGMLLLPLVHRPALDRWVEPLGVALAWLTATGISVMTSYMGGLSSPYYAGLTLIVLAAGLLFVWPLTYVVSAQIGIVASFLLVNLASGTYANPGQGLSNLVFLSATALVAALGQALTYRTQREQLGQRVRLEQTTANLEKAHSELKRLDEFKSRFFANMTHELRTPLAMILTPLELLMQGEMGSFTDAQRSSFQTMFRSAMKLLKLINDLLDLSRLEESRLQLQVREHDLVEHLSALTEQTQVLAQRKGITLSFLSERAEALVTCDLERLERVFVNLLSNAIKFTPPGGQVQVKLGDRREWVAVTVEDDGVGFPPEKAEKLFERFYQVDMAGTRVYGGAGIGLALAREIVQLHGGTIEARSDGLRGARFTVLLRRGRQHLRPEVLVEAPVKADGDSGLDWAVRLSARRDFRLLDIEEAAERRAVERDTDEEARPHTVVVVEDNPRIVQLIHMTLRRQFKVRAALDGRKGLELIQRERPHLVVTDLMMPELDGLELVKLLREDPRTRQIPVIMLTARGELDDRVKGLETGVSAYLVKPFSPKELVTTARRLVQAEEQAADMVLTQRMDSLEIVAGGLAHEINNPLNYVKNSLHRVRLHVEQALSTVGSARERPLQPGELADLERAGTRLRELLSVADSGLKRIGQTVELMGRYGRAGYQRQLAPHDAWEAARTVVDVVLPATGRKVQVQVEATGDGTLECVPEEWNQVITNLVQNAIEAVPEETGRVWVRGSGDGDELVIRVSDNGPGIDPEVQARLFTPFFTTKGPGRGTGLGLTISRRVVQSLGGTLQLQSAPGQGTEFTIRVPRRRPQRELPFAG